VGKLAKIQRSRTPFHGLTAGGRAVESGLCTYVRAVLSLSPVADIYIQVHKPVLYSGAPAFDEISSSCLQFNLGLLLCQNDQRLWVNFFAELFARSGPSAVIKPSSPPNIRFF
jgi:hypothetical protein